MRTELTPAEIESYRENGFLVVPDLLDADDLGRWRTAVDEAVDERGDQTFAVPTAIDERQVATKAVGKARDYYDSVFTQRVNLWQTNTKVRDLMVDERLGHLVGSLAGVDGIRIWHDQALIKEPYANFTAFHLDVPFWSFTSADALSIWVALDDATLQNGCLYYVPGSQAAGKYENVDIGPELGALFDVYPDWRNVAAVPCPVPAGGACFHNGRTFHGAGANMTPGRRRAMTCGYMPAGSTFNGQPNILPPGYLATLAVGDVLANDDQNPVIFSRA